MIYKYPKYSNKDIERTKRGCNIRFTYLQKK